jgi:hypothetical protein
MMSDNFCTNLIRLAINAIALGQSRQGNLGSRAIVYGETYLTVRRDGLHMRFFSEFHKLYLFPIKGQIGGALCEVFNSRFA